MAASFFVISKKKNGFATLFARLQSSKQSINHKAQTPFEVNYTAFKNAQKGPTAMANFKKANPELAAFMDKLKLRLEETESFPQPITLDQFKKIIQDVAFEDIREKRKAAAAEAKAKREAAKKMTLDKFINQYISDVESGARQTEQGRNYAKSTVKAIKQALVQFREFEKTKHEKFDFDDIDMRFYQEFTAWLRAKNYAINSIGKCIKQLKVIMFTAQSEGHHNNNLWKDRKFKGTRVEVDNIYLTKEDLDKMMSADLSKLSPGHEIARDIFMVGVWTAQRVSDYNHIHKEDFEDYTVRSIVDEPDPDNPGKIRSRIETNVIKIVNIRQQKTGAKVAIPCSPHLIEILEKYNYQMPYLVDNVINRYIKDVAEEAGLTELVEIQTTKGGNVKTERVEKYKLIHTHTARRTGATLMYLAGMDVYDIIKITGHSSPVMLRKYIKADELDVVNKIMNKYDYFK